MDLVGAGSAYAAVYCLFVVFTHEFPFESIALPSSLVLPCHGGSAGTVVKSSQLLHLTSQTDRAYLWCGLRFTASAELFQVHSIC